MTARFINVDRHTPLLLPPDLRDWVPEDDLVHFILEVVASMTDLNLKVNARGGGSAQYPPKTMLTLLIYCYANGVFSSRRIERATYRDVAVRYLMADHHPDHDTICKFRRENLSAIKQAFVQVLQLAKRLGLLRVGTVSIDGTHVHANASKDRNVGHDRAVELEAELSERIDQLLEQAEAADASADDDDQRLPEQFDRLSKLREQVRAAREALEAEARQQAEAASKAYEQKLDEYEERGGGGRKPRPPGDPAMPMRQQNLTDGDSRLLRKHRRAGYTQSYNAQAAVDADGSMLILAEDVGQGGDAEHLSPMIQQVQANTGDTATAALADAGYAKAQTFRDYADDSQGKEGVEGKTELYVAVGRDETTCRAFDFRRQSATRGQDKQVRDPDLLAMREKLRTDEGRALYRLRKQTVEPVFGIIKQVLGFRRFLLRGLEQVRGEWTLVSLAYNVKRLHKLKTAS